jgi:hypothetical protein
MACRRWYESTGNIILSCLVHCLYSTSLYFQSCWGPLSVRSDSRSQHFILPLLLADFLFANYVHVSNTHVIYLIWRSIKYSGVLWRDMWIANTSPPKLFATGLWWLSKLGDSFYCSSLLLDRTC